jgi:hypothetical protein
MLIFEHGMEPGHIQRRELLKGLPEYFQRHFGFLPEFFLAYLKKAHAHLSHR